MKTQQFISCLFLLLLILNLSACNVLGSEEVDEEVLVEKTEDAIIVTNETSSTIYTAMYERESLALLDMYICHNPGRCEGVSSGQSETLKLQEVYGYKPGDEVVVWWWRLREKAGTDDYEIVDFTSVVIDT